MKNVVCLPQKIVKGDYMILKKTFSIEEFLHLTMLVSMHKARVELTMLSLIIYDLIKAID